jgi:hypothetical protein
MLPFHPYISDRVEIDMLVGCLQAYSFVTIPWPLLVDWKRTSIEKAGGFRWFLSLLRDLGGNYRRVL